MIRNRTGRAKLASVVIALALASCSSGLLGIDLPTGANTATIAVTIPRSGQPSFTGTVAGGTLSGSVDPEIPNPAGYGEPSYSYKGSLGGHHFVLHVGIHANLNTSKGIFGAFSFVVTGSYGSERIKASASFNLGHALANTQKFTLPFDGHIGTQRVTGTATARQRGKGLAITATFTIH